MQASLTKGSRAVESLHQTSTDTSPVDDPGRLRTRPSEGGPLFVWLGLLWLMALAPTALLVLNAIDLLAPTGAVAARAADGAVTSPRPWQTAGLAGFWASLALVFTTVITRRLVQYVRTEVRSARSQHEGEADFLEHAPCGYHALDSAGRVLRVNHTELGWLARPASEVLGRPFTDFLTPAAAAKYREAASAPAGEGAARELEVDLLRPDGKEWPVLVRTCPAPSTSPSAGSSVGVVIDFREHQRAKAVLERLTRIDPLTELGNRRDFFERAEQELARSRRFNEPLALMILDIDHFKRINDGHGHAIGDDVLRHFSRLCRQSLRATDIAGRLGGEEFAVLMPAADLATATRAADRLRERVEAEPAPCAEGAPIAYTVSVGISTLDSWTAGVRDLLRKADLALYEAKRSGRNQVQVG